MEVGLIHHVEPLWSGAFDEDVLREAITRHFEDHQYDMVIMTTLECCGSYHWLDPFYTKEREWSYGWEDPELEHAKEWYKDSWIDTDDIIHATGHEFAYVYPWIRELKDWNWHLMGGHRYECLQDFIDTLEHLGSNYSLIDNCIYGG